MSESEQSEYRITIEKKADQWVATLSRFGSAEVANVSFEVGIRRFATPGYDWQTMVAALKGGCNWPAVINGTLPEEEACGERLV